MSDRRTAPRTRRARSGTSPTMPASRAGDVRHQGARGGGGERIPGARRLSGEPRRRPRGDPGRTVLGIPPGGGRYFKYRPPLVTTSRWIRLVWPRSSDDSVVPVLVLQGQAGSRPGRSRMGALLAPWRRGGRRPCRSVSWTRTRRRRLRCPSTRWKRTTTTGRLLPGGWRGERGRGTTERASACASAGRAASPSTLGSSLVRRWPAGAPTSWQGSEVGDDGKRGGRPWRVQVQLRGRHGDGRGRVAGHV